MFASFCQLSSWINGIVHIKNKSLFFVINTNKKKKLLFENNKKRYEKLWLLNLMTKMIFKSIFMESNNNPMP